MNWESFTVGVVVGALAAFLLSLYIFLKAYNSVMKQAVTELKDAVTPVSKLSVEEVE